MKKYSIFAFLLILGIFIAYRVGFKQGYNYTIPAAEMAFDQGIIKDITKDDFDKLHWITKSRCRSFGNYYLFKPNDDSIASLWIFPKDKPYFPIIMIEDRGEELFFSITDNNGNDIDINYNHKKNRLSRLTYFCNGIYFTDFNLNGIGDLRAIKQKDGYLKEIQIDSVWYKYTNQKKGKKNYMYINTKDGKKEVDRDGGDYYIKSEQKDVLNPPSSGK